MEKKRTTKRRDVLTTTTTTVGPKKPQVVRVNATLLRYEVVRKIARDRGWQLITDESDKAAIASCTLHWIDVPDFHPTFKVLQPFAKVNHFPGMTNLARKSKLARNFDRMKKLFPDEYDFCPKTWILPFDMYDFQQQFHSDTGLSQKTFIVKPDHNCQGRGVFLTRQLSQINRTDVMVAQQYVKAPLLIEGKKFDLRIYVLISSCNPLRVYLFKDGLVRMCTADYVTPNAANMEQRFMHLTNYAVNKHADNFEVNKNASEDGSGSKRSLRWFFAWLKTAKGFDDSKVATLWEKIGDICLKAILAVQPTLALEYRSTFAKNLRKVSSASVSGGSGSGGLQHPDLHQSTSSTSTSTRPSSAPESTGVWASYSSPNAGAESSSFAILGMDVLVDEALKPWLLEVNHLPSFGCDSPLDWNIKERLISQTLDIMRISPDDKDKYEAELAKSMQRRLYGGMPLAGSGLATDNNRDENASEGDSGTYKSLGGEELRVALTAYYQRFNAERLKDLDKIVTKYQHNQEELNKSLQQKYGKSIHDFASRRATKEIRPVVAPEQDDDQEEDADDEEESDDGVDEEDEETLMDYSLIFPPLRHEFLDSKYRKMLEASQQHMDEQQMRFSAPLHHNRRASADGSADHPADVMQSSSFLPPVRGAFRKGDMLGRDCFGFTGTDKAKWLTNMERNKKPLVAPGPEQIAAAHRLMLGHSSQKLSVKPPTPPEQQVPRARRESVNYGMQYRERLASLKAKPTVAMSQISFG